VPTQTVATKLDVPFVSANQDTRVILTPDAFAVTVFPILNAVTIKLVRITNVSILVNYLVDQVLIAKLTIMWLFAGVLEDLLEIPSKAVEDLLKMRFVKLVVLILTVRLDKMTGQFVDAKKITLEILSKVVAVNVKPIETVVLLNSVLNSNVLLLVVKELVEKMPIVLLGTTDLNARVLLIS